MRIATSRAGVSPVAQSRGQRAVPRRFGTAQLGEVDAVIVAVAFVYLRTFRSSSVVSSSSTSSTPTWAPVMPP